MLSKRELQGLLANAYLCQAADLSLIRRGFENYPERLTPDFYNRLAESAPSKFGKAVIDPYIFTNGVRTNYAACVSFTMIDTFYVLFPKTNDVPVVREGAFPTHATAPILLFAGHSIDTHWETVAGNFISEVFAHLYEEVFKSNLAKTGEVD